MSGRRGRLRGVFLDVSPLREDRGYRWLWAGQLVSGAGNQITRIALPYQVYVLTGSTLAIAILTAAQFVPLLAFSLVAGSVADVVDRRRLLLVTQAASAAVSLGLLAVALLPSPPVALIVALAFVGSAVWSFDQPTRVASVPRLVPPSRLQAALALNQTSFQMQAIVGPTIGGFLLATTGIAGAYAADALSFGASILAVTRMPSLPPLGAIARPGLAAIREGLAYVGDRRVLLGSFVIDLNAMILAMPTSLFPVLALDVFRVGPAGVGLLAAAPAVGAFIGALTSGWLSRVRATGRTVVWSVGVWGLAIAAFGLATFSFPLALALFAVAGAADMVSAVLRAAIVQLETPDGLRGRVTSVNILVVRGGPYLGDIRGALVASLVGAHAAVVTGGLMCVAGAWLVARWFPELSEHRVEPAERVAA